MTPDDDLPPHMQEFYRDYTGQDDSEDPPEPQNSDTQGSEAKAPAGDDIFSAPPGHEAPSQKKPAGQQEGTQAQPDSASEQPQSASTGDDENTDGQPPSQNQPSSGQASSRADQNAETPSPPSDTPTGHEDWGQNDLLHQLGVYETGSMDPDKATQVERLVRGAEGDQPSGSVFVRGSKYGSSFLIKLGDWLMILLAVGLLGGLGYGTWWGFQKVIGSNAEGGSPQPTAMAPANQNGDTELAAIAQQQGWTYCQPQSVPESQQVAVLAKLPQVVIGDAQLPRDPESLREAEGSQTEIMENGDRRDRFSPPGAQLVARYQGTSSDVKHITIRFNEVRPFCRSLQTLGLLPGPAAFQFSQQGQVRPQQGELASFFQQGQVYMQLENQEVRYMRLVPTQ